MRRIAPGVIPTDASGPQRIWNPSASVLQCLVPEPHAHLQSNLFYVFTQVSRP